MQRLLCFPRLGTYQSLTKPSNDNTHLNNVICPSASVHICVLGHMNTPALQRHNMRVMARTPHANSSSSNSRL